MAWHLRLSMEFLLAEQTKTWGRAHSICKCVPDGVQQLLDHREFAHVWAKAGPRRIRGDLSQSESPRVQTMFLCAEKTPVIRVVFESLTIPTEPLAIANDESGSVQHQHHLHFRRCHLESHSVVAWSSLTLAWLDHFRFALEKRWFQWNMSQRKMPEFGCGWPCGLYLGETDVNCRRQSAKSVDMIWALKRKPLDLEHSETSSTKLVG